VVPIVVYRRLISPLLPRSCRYHPSCSRYGMDAILAHGVFRGGALALARIFRCWGWFSGGNDPVPEAWSWRVLSAGYRSFYSGPGSRRRSGLRGADDQGSGSSGAGSGDPE
jgi:putative membrane protein insertion efficiency factor